MSESELEKIANKTGMNEPKFVKSLGILGIIGLASIPVVGWFGALYSGAIVTGLLGRYLGRNRRNAYKAQRELNKIYKERNRKEKELLQIYRYKVAT